MATVAITSSIGPTLANDAISVLRQQMAEAVARGDPHLVTVLATIISSLARGETEKDGPNPRLREWQALALDAAAAARAIAPAAAAELARAAAAVRHMIMLAVRNPASQLASRPTSRRVLQAIQQLGGVLCAQTRVRELSDQTPTHFSNTLKILRAAGLVVSESDRADGRERRLSLTSEGRTALAAHGGERPDLPPPQRLHVGARDRAHLDNGLRPASRRDGGYRNSLRTEAVLQEAGT